MGNNLHQEMRHVQDLIEARALQPALLRVAQLKKTWPLEAKVWNLSARVHSLRSETDLALLDRSRAVELCGDEPHYIYMRGIELFEIGRFAAGIADFTHAIRLCDEHQNDYYRSGALFFRAECYIRLHNPESALADCEHIPEGMKTWTDRMRSKSELVAEAQKLKR